MDSWLQSARVDALEAPPCPRVLESGQGSLVLSTPAADAAVLPTLVRRGLGLHTKRSSTKTLDTGSRFVRRSSGRSTCR